MQTCSITGSLLVYLLQDSISTKICTYHKFSNLWVTPLSVFFQFSLQHSCYGAQTLQHYPVFNMFNILYFFWLQYSPNWLSSLSWTNDINRSLWCVKIIPLLDVCLDSNILPRTVPFSNSLHRQWPDYQLWGSLHTDHSTPDWPLQACRCLRNGGLWLFGHSRLLHLFISRWNKLKMRKF